MTHSDYFRHVFEQLPQGNLWLALMLVVIVIAAIGLRVRMARPAMLKMFRLEAYLHAKKFLETNRNTLPAWEVVDGEVFLNEKAAEMGLPLPYPPTKGSGL